MELGHTVVIAGLANYRQLRKIKYPYRVIGWPRIPFLPKDIRLRILLIITRLTYRWDIVHAHTTYPNGYTAAWLKTISDFPLIITPHGADIHKVPEIGFGHRMDPKIERKIIYALNRANYTTAISKSVESSIRDLGLENEKIISIPNGVDKKRFTTPSSFDVFDYLNVPRDSKLIVSVGNYHQRKGHETLVKAIQKVHESESKVILVIVGNTSEKFCQKIHDEGADNYIKFTGILGFPVFGGENKEDILVALLHASRAYISSSIAEGTEGLSLAVLEAMAANTCVIATRVSGNRDVITDGENGLLVEPRSVKNMSDAILRVCADKSLADRLSDGGQRFVEKYSWLEITQQYLDLYERTINETN